MNINNMGINGIPVNEVPGNNNGKKGAKSLKGSDAIKAATIEQLLPKSNKSKNIDSFLPSSDTLSQLKTYTHLASRTFIAAGLLGEEEDNTPFKMLEELMSKLKLVTENEIEDILGGLSSDEVMDSLNGVSADEAANAISSGSENSSMEIEVSMDLFWSLSKRITEESGEDMAGRFHRTTKEVAEAFSADFSMKIKMTEGYLQNTEKVVEFDQELLGDFFDAMDGLANMDDASVEAFAEASDKFFGDLAERYEGAEEAFVEIGEALEQQVRTFFDDVKSTKQLMKTGPTGIPENLTALLPE